MRRRSALELLLAVLVDLCLRQGQVAGFHANRVRARRIHRETRDRRFGSVSGALTVWSNGETKKTLERWRPVNEHAVEQLQKQLAAGTLTQGGEESPAGVVPI